MRTPAQQCALAPLTRNQTQPYTAVDVSSCVDAYMTLTYCRIVPATVPDPQASYTALKAQLLRRTQYCGAFLVVYLGLVASLQASCTDARRPLQSKLG